MGLPAMSDTQIDRLVIFGATGDLAARMLLPSLYFLDADRLLSPDFKVIGSARSPMDHETFVAYVRGVLEKRTDGVDTPVWERFAARLHYCQADVTKAEGLKGLTEL